MKTKSKVESPINPEALKPRDCECGNCEWKGDETGLRCELVDIEDLAKRLDPGCTVPAGECPECGALAYLVEKPAPPQPERAATREAHTPTPWRYQSDALYTPKHAVFGPPASDGGNYGAIARTSEESDARLICRAANSHAELLEIARLVAHVIETTNPDSDHYLDSGADSIQLLLDRQADIESAISKAERAR